MFEVTSKVSNVIVVISMQIKKYDDGAWIDVLSLARLWQSHYQIWGSDLFKKKYSELDKMSC